MLEIPSGPEFYYSFGPLLIPAIMGGISLISSMIAARSSKKQMQQTNQGNLELAKYSYGEQQKQVAAQNLYNSPAQQMQRFDDAGLNPHLIYGQGSSGQQTTTPTFNAPRYDAHFNPLQIPEILGPFQDFAMKQAQIDNVKASTESTKTDIGTKLLSRLLLQANIGIKDTQLKYADQLGKYQTDIKHGQAQSAYSKVIQEMLKVDRLKLENSLRAQAVEQGPLKTETMRAEMIFRQFRNQWMKMGITSGDHFLIRALSRALSSGEIQFGTPDPVNPFKE